MKSFLGCLSDEELVLVIGPLAMFVMFVLCICGAFVKQCGDEGLCTRKRETAVRI